MINKIGNWVFGSFFRTIGRLLVFILLGVIIANLVDFGALIDNFRITDLFFDKVKADTLTYNEIITYYSNSAKTNQLPFPSGTSGVQYYELTGTGNDIETALIYTSRTFVKDSNTKYIRIPFMVTGNTWATSTNFLDREVICDWVQNENYTYQPYNCRYWGTGTYASPVDANIKINVSLYSTSGTQTPCIIEDDNIKCELLNNQVYNAIYFKYSVSQSNTTYPIRLNFNRGVNFYTDNTQEIINNQNSNTQQQMQQQQQQHQELMDDNTTEADTEGQDFVNNFSNNSHGLTGIITAPLSAIQSLASATCSPLVLPLPFTNNKSLTLPCMNSIYTQYFGAFYTMYQGIILALISYWVCVRLFTLVKGFKDPEDDKIEVMDL